MRKIVKELEFWVSNITDLNVCLSDLALTVPSRKNVNLLDSRHYSYTLEQLEASAKSGSLKAKSDKLKVRKVAPEILVKPGVNVSTMPRFIAQNSQRTKIIINEEKYEELQISEEKFAEEMSED